MRESSLYPRELELMIESCLNSPAVTCSFYLFQYGNTVVEINLVGAVLPLLFSIFILSIYRRRLRWLRVGVFVIISSIIITGIGSGAGVLYGGLGTPGWLYILFWLLTVVWYSRLRVVKAEVLIVAAELYVIGTLAVLMDDALRTFLGFLNIPVIGLNITPNIWGAAGPMDGIFMTGMYQAIIYLMIAVLRTEKWSRQHSYGSTPPL